MSAAAAETWQTEPLIAALKFLGAKNPNDARCSRKPKEEDPYCVCRAKKKRVIFQKVLGGGEIARCGDCYKPTRPK